jgi:hypothetical protein
MNETLDGVLKVSKQFLNVITKAGDIFADLKAKLKDGWEISGVSIGFNDDETFNINVNLVIDSDPANEGRSNYGNFSCSAQTVDDLLAKEKIILTLDAASEPADEIANA